MRKLLKKSLAVLLAALLAFSFAAMPATAGAETKPVSSIGEKYDKDDYKEGEAIVVLNKSADGNYLKAGNASNLYGNSIKLKSSYSFTGKNKKNKLNVAVLKSSKYSTKQLIKKLKKNPAVKYAFANRKNHALDISNDTYSKFQWALENNGQNGGTAGNDVNAETLWESAEASKKDQIVAVVDTGFDFTHPDLQDVVWTNTHGSKLLGKHGYDFVNLDGDPQDDNGHGTHCAGIIAAAADNAIGVSGINKSHTKIMPVKWLDNEGSGYTEDVLSAYDYINRAIDLGENIVAISNSWGGSGEEDELSTFEEIFDNFGEKGVVSLVAAGNESQDISDAVTEQVNIFGMLFEDAYYVIPASCQSHYSLTVAATNENDELAGFSNYSKTRVDVAAPGCDILSTVSYDCFNPSAYSDEKKAALVAQYQNYDGTVTDTDFGYPVAVPITHEQSEDYFTVDFSINVTVSQTDKHFGDSGKSITLTTNDVIDVPEDSDEPDALLYCFEIPYTIPDDSKNYSVSFMASNNTDCIAVVSDVPADYDITKDFESVIYGPYVKDSFGGNEGGTYWSHISYNVDVSDKSSFKKATQRKLLFVAEAYEQGTEFTFDDLAISVQGVDTAEFERYDFYNGTSMATPYVAGAVALLRNAFPDSTARDVVNMIKNTGRTVAGLADKVESGRVLSLDNTDKIPPMIFNAKYDDKGAVLIDGSFKNVTSVKINGKAVTPISSTGSEITVPDSSYSTKKITVEAENAYGTDSYTGLVSKKKLIEKSTEVDGEPLDTTGGFMLPAGDTAYYVNTYNNVASISYDSDMELYVYDEFSHPSIDLSKLFPAKDNEEISKESQSAYINSAVYSNGRIYVVAISPVTTSQGVVIGYENAFGYYDINKGETFGICEVPDEVLFGSSLAAYNGSIYLAGGYDDENDTYSNAVYKFNTSKKAFKKEAAALPEGRAYTKFIQYENKLYGVYGAIKSGEMPAIISFDGSKWTASKVKFDSEDYDEYLIGKSVSVKVYDGNLGYGKGGLFLNGVYVYGYGDTYDYNVAGDKLVASAYAAKNTLEGTKLIGTTLPDCFIGYEKTAEIEIDDIDDFNAYSISRYIAKGDSFDSNGDDDIDDIDYEPIATAYKLNTATSYAKVTCNVKNAKVKTSKKNIAFGDTVAVNVVANTGYAVESISANGKVVAKNTNKATVRATTAAIKITASVKYVAPAKVKKVKATAKNGKVTVSWKKVNKATGYQVQQLKKGKWKTVKTIKKAKTVKCTVKAKKGTKFRVRAIGKYNKQTVYGKWSKAVKAK